MEKKKVLIIDDEVEFCLLMQYYLRKKGCEVGYCIGLDEGLQYIASFRPDIIIADQDITYDAREKIESKLKQIEGPSPNLFLMKTSNNNVSTPHSENNDSTHTTIIDELKKLVEFIKNKFKL